MVRRRSTKQKAAKSHPRRVDRKDSKLKRWNKPSDIPLDEEDQFHASRDKILLDGQQLEDDDGDDDEVFALKGMPQSSEDEEEDEEEDVDDSGGLPSRNTPSGTKANALSKKNSKGVAPTSPPSSGSEESEEEETWGKTRSAYYSSNAAQLDSDDEEANELEEQEAIRLQAKARDTMGDDDFGLADIPDTVVEEHEFEEVQTSAEQPALPLDKAAIIRHLEKTSPETLALAREWEDVVDDLMKVEQKLAKPENNNEEALDLSLLHVYHQALLTYSTTLAFYLYLRASEKYAQRPELLKSHPVLSRLLTLKQSLSTLESLDFNASDSDEDEDEDENALSWKDEMMRDAQQLWSSQRKHGLDLDELEDLLRDAEDGLSADESTPVSKKKSRSQSQLHGKEPPKKKRRTAEEERTTPVHKFDLVEPAFKPTKSSARTQSANLDHFGESQLLQHADAKDKEARRKTLRFHTSKIESASARRQGARNAVGGDDDIPYRDRRKEEMERRVREAKAKASLGADLDEAEPEPRETEKTARESDSESSGEEGADGYYDLVQKHKKEKKQKRKADYEATQEAARPTLNDATDGPRSLTRAILANKGLTPHRSKSVRNPRVKKRQRFEKAKKKLASQKAVYKGGIGNSGRYDGEKSGISRVVKSVRF